MKRKPKWPIALVLTVAIGALVASATPAGAWSPGGSNSCPQGSSLWYCIPHCHPPNVVGEPLGSAIRDIFQAGCTVGQITCIRKDSSSTDTNRASRCGEWWWRGGHRWANYRNAGSWRSGDSGQGAPARYGPRPWHADVVVVAQSPGPGGEYALWTPIDLTIELRSQSRANGSG